VSARRIFVDQFYPAFTHLLGIALARYEAIPQINNQGDQLASGGARLNVTLLNKTGLPVNMSVDTVLITLSDRGLAYV